MDMNFSHPDDLELLADDYEEQQLMLKMEAEEAGELTEEEEVEQMMQKYFDKDSEEKEETQVCLFERDGDYGWITFAGIFENLDIALAIANESGNRNLTVAEAGEHFEDGLDLDFFIVDVSEKVSEILYGVRVVPINSFA